MSASDTSSGLPVTPGVVTWARQRAGLSIEEAAKTLRNIAAWEAGQGGPTYPQLESMAVRFKCPVAVFFFPAPPDVPDPDETFRTLNAESLREIPRLVRALLREAQAMQVNLAELNDGKNPADRQITRDLQFTPATTLEEAAAAVRGYLGVTIAEQAAWRTVEEALEGWREAFAKVGIYVFKDAFHSDSYFGFCLYNEQFPVIYVNNSVAKTRQIFTLFHELGHLLFQTSGIDVLDQGYIDQLPDDDRAIEIVCNGLAAKVLVPDDVYEERARGLSANRASAASLAAFFNVSREVVYRKMLDRRQISSEEYTDAAEFWRSQVKTKEGGGGNYYNTRFSYLGRRYVELAFRRYYQRRFDEQQLSDYLNIKPRSLAWFEQKYAEGI